MHGITIYSPAGNKKRLKRFLSVKCVLHLPPEIYEQLIRKREKDCR